jgi:outer membrane protein
MMAGSSVFAQKKTDKDRPHFINFNNILQQYEKLNSLNDLLKKRDEAVTAQIDSLTKIITAEQPKIKDIESDPTMTEASRQKYMQWVYGVNSMLNDLTAEKQNGYQQFIKAFENDMINDINQYVAEYAKAEGLYMILGANGSGNVMYADPAYDLTEEILEGLNQRYKAAIEESK